MAEAEILKTCDVCKLSSNLTSDVLMLGDWMEHHGITVHYFCLLLSTHLPQNGEDTSGILGFLLRDIRNEIQARARQACCYCEKKHASVSCYTCKDYFHVKCGYKNRCVFYFLDDFRSYCDHCAPLTDIQRKHSNLPAETRDRTCAICRDHMGLYDPVKWIYGECCGNGFAHIICMREYALKAGYYLKCIWCKDTKFREYVRKQSVFVPDRDADWERQRNAYSDLHRAHNRCDMQECLCPRGRECHWGKWNLIRCALCGSFGAHNPVCIAGNIKSTNIFKEFKCDTCRIIEKSKSQDRPNRVSNGAKMNISLYAPKTIKDEIDLDSHETPSFSELNIQTLVCPNETTQAPDDMAASMTTDLNDATQQQQTSTVETPALEECAIIDLCSQNQEDEIREELPINSAEIEDISDAIYAEMQRNGLFKDCCELFPTTQDPIDNRFVTFGVFKFNADESKCLGQCKVRIDLTSPRFMGKSIDEIKETPGLLTEDDVVEHVDDSGMFAGIDKFLANLNTV